MFIHIFPPLPKYECVNPIILAYKILSTSYLSQFLYVNPTSYPLTFLNTSPVPCACVCVFPLLYPILYFYPIPSASYQSISQPKNGYYYTTTTNPCQPYQSKTQSAQRVLLYTYSSTCQPLENGYYYTTSHSFVNYPTPQFLQIVTIKIP